jgi:hypothetical protein
MQRRSTQYAAIGLALSLLTGLAACGDDGGGPSGNPDSGVPQQDGGGPDAGPPPATFTAFVIDLVEHQTTATAEPAPIDFDLPDPDGADNVTTAYDSLFE